MNSEIRLTPEEKVLVKDTFNQFIDSNIEFIVLRRHEKLPEAIPGTEKDKLFDIDLLVHHTDYNEAFNSLKNSGFKKNPSRPESSSFEVFNLVHQAINQPAYALKEVVASPKNVIKQIYGSLQENLDSPSNPYEKVKKKGSYSTGLRHIDLDRIKFDLKAHLAYKSPSNQKYYRVDPTVENLMLERKIYENNIPRPSQSDELCHLICHRLYDKQGEFTEYYIHRCNKLKKIVLDDDNMDKEFKKLLKFIFFDASEYVYQKVKSGEYNNLLEDLRRYSDY